VVDVGEAVSWVEKEGVWSGRFADVPSRAVRSTSTSLLGRDIFL
jgi:hypothetical protein